MNYKVENAIIMAAGTASRFAPLSFEQPKALIEVNGEILLERQIRQLKDAGVPEIFLVVGYKADQFEYLKDKFGIKLLHNSDYLTRNNNASIYVAKEVLRNSYICSSDNYFAQNPFENEVSGAYYAAVYSEGETAEWCMTEDEEGYINSVQIGGRDAWYMLGHTFWDEEFSVKFMEILDEIYDLPETKNLLWERIYMDHLDVLKMRMRKYEPGVIYEFDTLDELREFDTSYIDDTRSEILKSIAKELGCRESDLVNIRDIKTKDNEADGIRFIAKGKEYEYEYLNAQLMPV